MSAEAWAAVGAAATCVVVVVYLWLGFLGVRQLREARLSREEQARPFVIVDFTFRKFLIYLTVRNIGKTPALDVSITFDQPLSSTLEDAEAVTDSPLFKAPIPMLAPGRVISVLFDGPTRFTDASLPRIYYVTVKYSDPKRRRFEDPPYPLDLNQYLGSALEQDGLPELVKEVKDIGRTLGRWTDGIRGLQVKTLDKRREDHEQFQRHIRRGVVTAYRQDGLRSAIRYLWRNRRFIR